MTGEAEPWYNVVLDLPNQALRLARNAHESFYPPPYPVFLPILTLRMPFVLLTDERTAIEALARALHPIPPLTITVEGWGVYPSGTVYLHVLPSPQLLRLHASIRGALAPVSRELMPERDGPNWQPHIALGPRAVGQNLPLLVARLRAANYQPRASFAAHQINLARREGNRWPVLCRLPLGGAY